jgi:toxin ParE1/3/4
VRHELIIRPEAEAELAAAYAWYDERVQGLGDHFLLSVDAVL